MNINFTALISILCTVITSLLAFLSYKNNLKGRSNEEITDRVKRDTAISTKLDMVIVGNSELKNEIKSINDKFDEISERVARYEEKTKNAQDRIDKLESKSRFEVIRWKNF